MDKVQKPDEGLVLSKALGNLQRELNISNTEMAQLLGVGRNTVGRTVGKRAISPDSNEGQRAMVLIRIYRSLFALVGRESADIRHWLHSGNRHLRGVPIELMKNIQGLCLVVAYLDAMRARV